MLNTYAYETECLEKIKEFLVFSLLYIKNGESMTFSIVSNINIDDNHFRMSPLKWVSDFMLFVL